MIKDDEVSGDELVTETDVLKEIVITVKNDKLVSDEMTQECDE
jgi:hypothetical protein